MTEPMYSTTQQFKWQNRLLWASFVGSIIWTIAFIGHWYYFPRDGWGYGVIVMGPVLLLITPMHLLLTGLTAYTWSDWSNKRKRTVTLICSLSVPSSLFLITALRLF